MMPSPATLIGGTEELPQVEQLGTITLETLHQYHCNNPDRRLLSIFGKIYDVTSSLNSYGPDGAYKEYAGHDMTLAIAFSKTDDRWLDRFVKMEQKWVNDAQGWSEYFDHKYPVCGKLDKWDEDTETWPELTAEETQDIKKGCIIM